MIVEPQLANTVKPASGKIYDITHADTDEHSVALPAGYPANTRAIHIYASRTVGTGKFRVPSVPGDVFSAIVTGQLGLWIRAADGLFYYVLTAANDEWDIYANGYITA